jgi:ATP-dependent DNA helicase PIF1
MELSLGQKIAYDKYVNGENIFITGPGGAGKSALIKLIYKHALSRFKDIHVTALTGCASILLNCKAKTLHSWAGIGLGNGSIENYVLKIKKNKFLKAIWRETDILVVDEVSMLSLKLFDMLNAIGKAVRGNQKPFGGIQLIFSGDFYQLPPVGDHLEPDTQRFCFESDNWNSVFHRDNQIELVKIFRQTDEIYSTILNQIREGKIKRKSNDLLLQYVGRDLAANLVAEPTKLFPTKNKVEQINIMRMSALHGEDKDFTIRYMTDLEMTRSEKEVRRQFSQNDIKLELDFLASNLMCEKDIKLKLGAQVMCIVNIKSEQGDILICNGSQGIIKEFCEFTGCPKVKYNNGIEMIMVRHTWLSDKIPGIGVAQVPLILSWALTIHKSQGATLDAAEIDVGSGIFECGQTYVALSRVKSLEGLYLTSYDAKRVRINKKVKDYYESLRLYHESKESNQEIYVPLVIAEPIQTAEPIGSGTGNYELNNTGETISFTNFQYVEANAELAEEKYIEPQGHFDPTIKVITLN